MPAAAARWRARGLRGQTTSPSPPAAGPRSPRTARRPRSPARADRTSKGRGPSRRSPRCKTAGARGCGPARSSHTRPIPARPHHHAGQPELQLPALRALGADGSLAWRRRLDGGAGQTDHDRDDQTRAARRHAWRLYGRSSTPASLAGSPQRRRLFQPTAPRKFGESISRSGPPVIRANIASMFIIFFVMRPTRILPRRVDGWIRANSAAFQNDDHLE